MATEKTQKRTPIKTPQDDVDQFVHSLAQSVNKTLNKSNYNDLMIGGQGNDDMSVPYWVRTYLPALDYAVGGANHPGFPGARIIELYGAEGSGKSTLCVWLVKQAIEQLHTFAVYQDAERVLTEEIIKGTQIDMDKIIYQQPDTLEEVFETQQAVLDNLGTQTTKRPVVTALDSVAACSTKSEIEGDYGDSTMGIHARIMSQAMRKIKSPVLENQVLSLFVNQIREKMNVSWGAKTDTFGGKALKFYASVRIELAKIKTLRSGDKPPYGCTIQATLFKNKVAPPMRKATFDILFVEDDDGCSYPQIDYIGAILDWCKANKIIGGGMGRYEIDGKSLYKVQAREYLTDHPDLLDDLIEKSYSVKSANLPKASGSDEDGEDDEE